MQARYGDQVVVDFCMRYGNPSTKSKVRAMTEAGCQKILFFPLYPHYAGATSATANDEFFRALMLEKWQPTTRTVQPYFENPKYIDALAQSIERAYANLETRPDILVCSYHGVPIRYLMEGDPYHCQCQKTTRLLKERLGLGRHRNQNDLPVQVRARGVVAALHCRRSRAFGREAGKKNIAVCAPAFSADCIETLEEINEEIKESFEEAGGERFTYIPCLNDDGPHIAALSSVIEDNLKGWLD